MESKLKFYTLLLTLILISAKFVNCKDDWDIEDLDDFGESVSQIVSVFISFTALLIMICICIACCGCCKRNSDNGRVFSAPIIVTSESHMPHTTQRPTNQISTVQTTVPSYQLPYPIESANPPSYDEVVNSGYKQPPYNPTYRN